MQPGPIDDIAHDRRNHAVLLDRSRRDLLAWITPDSIEAFSSLYSEDERLNRIIPGLANHSIGRKDNLLILSASRKGWRGGQVENVLIEKTKQRLEAGKDMEIPMGPGLKDR